MGKHDSDKNSPIAGTIFVFAALIWVSVMTASPLLLLATICIGIGVITHWLSGRQSTGNPDGEIPDRETDVIETFKPIDMSRDVPDYMQKS